MSVDIRIELHDIIQATTGTQRVRRVCVLSINGKSPAGAGLLEIKRQNPQDYQKLLNVAKLVAANHELRGKHVKRGKGKWRDIFEMKGGKGRLFFFIQEDTQQVVICTNTYWKTKPSAKEQNQAFEKASKLKAIYDDWRAQQGA